VDLLSLYKAVDSVGVNRVGIADTVGCASPRQVYDVRILQATPFENLCVNIRASNHNSLFFMHFEELSEWQKLTILTAGSHVKECCL
jgi:hypothetical protein